MDDDDSYVVLDMKKRVSFQTPFEDSEMSDFKTSVD